MFYEEDNMLMLSGIQHFYFCKRQWALIHIEQQWKENIGTAEGKIVHEKVDDPFLVETRGNLVIARSMPISSRRLGLYGVADVVEFIKTETEGIELENREGVWKPVPIEYKRGEPKNDDRDKVQLCAQAICLEEMLNVEIEKGYLFYNAIKRRIEVIFEEELRNTVKKFAAEMHQVFNDKKTPKCKKEKHCKACSMEEICQPKITGKMIKINDYIKKGLEKE